MFTPQECIDVYCKHINKSYNQLKVEQKALLSDAIEDNLRGRYPKLFMWSEEKYNEFIKDMLDKGIDYHDMDLVTRWAFEDAYDM